MNFDINNPVVQLCAKGMEMEGQGKMAEAADLFMEAWNSSSNDFEKFISAHYVARHQPSTADKIKWDEMALHHALKTQQHSIQPVLPSLYLNIGKGYEDLCDFDAALKNYRYASSFAQHLEPDGYGNMIRAGIEAGLKRVTVS